MADPQTDPLDALAAQHGAVTAGASASDPLDALAAEHGASSRPQMTFAIVNGQRVPVEDTPDEPNTVGTMVKHIGDQVNPITTAQALGNAVIHPLDTVKAIGAAQGALFDKAKASYDKGDYGTAARHFMDYLLPLVGPSLDTAADRSQRGQVAAGAGDAIGLGLALFGPKALQNVAAARYPLAASPAATAPKPANPLVQFAQQRDIPFDAATVSDNLAVKGAQALADRSIGGSVVATPANAARAEAMTRVGGELADETGAMVNTTEQAGTAIRDALAAKMATHTRQANQAYEELRTLEDDPANHMVMPGKPKPVDGLSEPMRGQLRRMVHELDASGFVKGQLNQDEPGVGSGTTYQPRSGGAQVFHDITSRMSEGANPTRGVVQNQLETYIAGGPETSVTKAALEVAEERQKARGGSTVSRPELPAFAMDTPTRLEADRVKGIDMGFPVNVGAVKKMLQPVYDQMKRQMPITQQQANPGLKALENIVTGDDWAPLSQVDRDLSAIKAVARSQGGLAKLAVSKLDAAVTEAAGYGGPHVTALLQQGRAATVAKYAASDVLDTLHDEPVRTIAKLTAPKDSAIQSLRAVTQQVPQQAATIARGYLEDLLAKPQRVAEWRKLGAQTKAILFPKAGQVQALDHFFDLADRISKTNVNPSGSGYVASLGAQGAMLWADPLSGTALQITGATLSKLLRSPVAINALTRGLTVPQTAPAVVRAATTANLLRAAQAAGVDLALPTAADQQGTGARR